MKKYIALVVIMLCLTLTTSAIAESFSFPMPDFGRDDVVESDGVTYDLYAESETDRKSLKSENAPKAETGYDTTSFTFRFDGLSPDSWNWFICQLRDGNGKVVKTFDYFVGDGTGRCVDYYVFSSVNVYYKLGYTISFYLADNEWINYDSTGHYFGNRDGTKQYFPIGTRIPYDNWYTFYTYIRTYTDENTLYVTEHNSLPSPSPTPAASGDPVTPTPSESEEPIVTPTPTPEDTSEPADIGDLGSIVHGISSLMKFVFDLFPLFGTMFVILLIILYIKVVL